MTIAWLFAACFQLPAPPFSFASQGGQENVLVPYDLRAVIPSFDQSWSWSQALLPSLADPEQSLPAVVLSELHHSEGPESILDLLVQALGEELHYEGRSIQIERDDQLLILAPQSVQAKVQEVLKLLETAFSSAVVVELDWFGFPDSGIPLERSVITQEEAKRFVDAAVARGSAHLTQTFLLSPGRTAAIESVRVVPVLLDYDVEIAQGSFIHDPIVRDIRHGFRAFLRGTTVPGGAQLSVLWLQEELVNDVKERPVTLHGAVGNEQRGGFELIEGPKSLQTASVMSHALAFDTFLPDGKAVVASSEVEVQGTTFRQVLVLRRAGGVQTSFAKIPLSNSGRALFVLNGELFGAPQFAISSGPAVDDEWPHPYVIAELRSEISPFLQDALARLSDWRTVGPWILVLSDQSWDGPASSDLERLVTAMKPPIELVELSGDCLAPNGTTPARFSLPALVGRSVGVVCGVTSQVIFDYDVEVAQNASVADPRLRPTFQGLCLGMEVSKAGATKAWVVRAQGTASFLGGAIPSIAPQGPFIGTIELPREERLSIDEHMILPISAPETNLRIGPRSRVEGEASSGVTVRIRG